jgi:hypothetical protein
LIAEAAEAATATATATETFTLLWLYYVFAHLIAKESATNSDQKKRKKFHLFLFRSLSDYLL